LTVANTTSISEFVSSMRIIARSVNAKYISLIQRKNPEFTERETEIISAINVAWYRKSLFVNAR